MFALADIPTGQIACGIYAIRGAGGCYVGQSVEVFARLRDHRKTLRSGTHRSTLLQDAFQAEILVEGLDPKEKEILALVEQEFMDALGASFNACPSSLSRAAAQKKRFEDPAQRELAGLARRGKKDKTKRIVGAEGRAKLSEARKGLQIWGGKRVLSEDYLESLRLAGERRRGRPSPKRGKPGKPASKETRRKMSASHQERIAARKEQGLPFAVTRELSEEDRKILGDFTRGKTWKIIDGKRVWLEKGE